MSRNITPSDFTFSTIQNIIVEGNSSSQLFSFANQSGASGAISTNQIVTLKTNSTGTWQLADETSNAVKFLTLLPDSGKIKIETSRGSFNLNLNLPEIKAAFNTAINQWAISKSIWYPSRNLQTISNNQVSFGESCALSLDGLTMVVGAPRYNSNEGRVFVYTRPSSSLSFGSPTVISPPVSATGSTTKFGNGVSVSADGSVVAIGAPLDDSGCGAVYVYENGVYANKLTLTKGLGEGSQDVLGDGQLGYSVSVSADGNQIVGGIPYRVSQVRLRDFCLTGATGTSGGILYNVNSNKLASTIGSIVANRTTLTFIDDQKTSETVIVTAISNNAFPSTLSFLRIVNFATGTTTVGTSVNFSLDTIVTSGEILTIPGQMLANSNAINIQSTPSIGWDTPIRMVHPIAGIASYIMKGMSSVLLTTNIKITPILAENTIANQQRCYIDFRSGSFCSFVKPSGGWSDLISGTTTPSGRLPNFDNSNLNNFLNRNGNLGYSISLSGNRKRVFLGAPNVLFTAAQASGGMLVYEQNKDNEYVARSNVTNAMGNDYYQHYKYLASNYDGTHVFSTAYSFRYKNVRAFGISSNSIGTFDYSTPSRFGDIVPLKEYLNVATNAVYYNYDDDDVCHFPIACNASGNTIMIGGSILPVSGVGKPITTLNVDGRYADENDCEELTGLVAPRIRSCALSGDGKIGAICSSETGAETIYTFY